MACNIIAPHVALLLTICVVLLCQNALGQLHEVLALYSTDGLREGVAASFLAEMIKVSFPKENLSIILSLSRVFTPIFRPYHLHLHRQLLLLSINYSILVQIFIFILILVFFLVLVYV